MTSNTSPPKSKFHAGGHKVHPSNPSNKSKDETTVSLKERILHILSVYPKISPTMLGISLNSKAKIWRAALNDLIEEKKVIMLHEVRIHPSERSYSYQILSLAPIQDLNALIEEA